MGEQMKNFVSEKGSITLYVLLTMLFFLILATGIYISVINSEITQKKATDRIKDIYEQEVNDIDNVYETMISRLEPKIYSYTGEVQIFMAPIDGRYKLEVWGAQGGSVSEIAGTGGKGGYSTGIINLEAGEMLYIYVGGEGGNAGTSMVTTVIGGYNGGGGATYYGGIGGGATDIRLIKGENWDDNYSLNSRIIVAGGGGRSTRT